jgi:hypothetical protein
METIPNYSLLGFPKQYSVTTIYQAFAILNKGLGICAFGCP